MLGSASPFVEGFGGTEMEYVVWFSIGLAGIAMFVLVFVWPMTLYNLFWVAVTNRTATLPVYYQMAGFPRVIYYSVRGKTRVIYGVLCLTCALSLHLAVADLIMNSCGSCYATPFQKYTLLTFVATLFIIALSGQWVVGRVNYSELHQEGGLFFWKGLIRRLLLNARNS